VGPGYALDDIDRELLLAESIAIPVPAVAGPTLLVLVMTFDPRDACACAPRGDAAVCLGHALDPALERPLFAWRTVDTLQIGADVPLCSVTVLKGIIQGAVDTRVRRYARRLVRPRVETGVTDVEREAWRTQWWNESDLRGRARTVSTADAGFTSVPLYFAELVAPQPSSSGHSPDEIAGAIAKAQGHIARTSIDSFEYRLIVPEGFVIDMESWVVSWIGVEPLAGCPPSADFLKLITVFGLPIHLHV
jgi:hypothetical protein